MDIILASASPRRVDLLRQMGLSFKSQKSHIIEDNTMNLPPHELVMFQAKAKAIDVKKHCPADSLILGADTIVVLNEEIYGKPLDNGTAKIMLKSLSGKIHEVITGVALFDSANNVLWTDYTVTKVKMALFDDRLIDQYIKTGEPLDKAGAYAIQGKGAMLVESITGCYTNVVGLPIPLVYNLLKKAGIDVL